jgi:hypothetical protein
MKNQSSVANKSQKAYEIMSRMGDDIYFEIEILCEGIKENIVGFEEPRIDTKNYLHQCMFLVECVLDYTRLKGKTIVHFVKKADRYAANTCKMIHLKQIGAAQAGIKNEIKNFKEAASNIFPGGIFPHELFSLKTKMLFVEIYMTDLFYVETTNLIPKVIELPDVLKFGSSVLN